MEPVPAPGVLWFPLRGGLLQPPLSLPGQNKLSAQFNMMKHNYMSSHKNICGKKIYTFSFNKVFTQKFPQYFLGAKHESGD